MLGLPPHDGSLFSAVRHFFLFLGLAYPVLIGVLVTPSIQRHFVYQHKILPIPLFANFSAPEQYSLAPGKTANLHFPTPDNETLGAWFVLNDPYHQQRLRASPALIPIDPPTPQVIREATSHRPTILFLHGAAATRAVEWRVKTYLGFTSRLHANVFAPDYRGFGDSTGTPSHEGLVTDAYASWKWLIDEGGAKAEDIVIVGHSLGTGVAAQLARRLSAEGVRPRGVVLLAPFTSVSKLLETYAILGMPVLQPLQTFPLGIKLMKRLLRHEFDTLSVIQDFNAPTLIAHSQDDFDIPHTHSRTLLDALLEPLLPPQPVSLPSAPGSPFSAEDFKAFTDAQEERRKVRSTLVRRREVASFGVVEEFDGGEDGKVSRVVYVETFWGSHAKIGTQEGVQDEIGKLFGLL